MVGEVEGPGAATRIYVATGATDMRLGFNGLNGLVYKRLQCDPLSGHLFLFANARRDRMKVIYFDGQDSGFARNGWRAAVSAGLKNSTLRKCTYSEVS
jgi:transposase